MLRLLPVVQEEAAIVSAKRVASNEAASAAEWAPEVVPPCLAEVIAIGQGRAGNHSKTSRDRLQRQIIVRWRLGLEFLAKIAHQQVGLGKQVGAEVIGVCGQVF